MEVFEAIKTRRSIRKYLPAPVDDKTLEQVLEAGRWAPSWKNSQCWYFIIVRDAVLKAALARYIEPNNGGRSAITSAPILIVACAELKKSGYKKRRAEYYSRRLGNV